MFIEISDGISINTESIHSVERLDALTCRVSMGDGAYDSVVPYEMMMIMIKNGTGTKPRSSFESGETSPYATQYIAM